MAFCSEFINQTQIRKSTKSSTSESRGWRPHSQIREPKQQRSNAPKPSYAVDLPPRWTLLLLPAPPPLQTRGRHARPVASSTRWPLLLVWTKLEDIYQQIIRKMNCFRTHPWLTFQ